MKLLDGTVKGWKCFAWCLDVKGQFYGLRIGPAFAHLKGPRCKPLFSERNAYVPCFWIGGGWRVLLRKDKPA